MRSAFHETVPVLNLSWVQPALALGGRFHWSAAARLAYDFRIRHVVDMREESMDDPDLLRSYGMGLLHAPVRDNHAPGLDALGAAVNWVTLRIRRGERVFVHCEHGIGRSILLGLCVLVTLDLEPLAAALAIKSRRACASPSWEQLETFVRWCEARGHTVDQDEVGRVLYAACPN